MKGGPIHLEKRRDSSTKLEDKVPSEMVLAPKPTLKNFGCVTEGANPTEMRVKAPDFEWNL